MGEIRNAAALYALVSLKEMKSKPNAPDVCWYKFIFFSNITFYSTGFDHYMWQDATLSVKSLLSCSCPPSLPLAIFLISSSLLLSQVRVVIVDENDCVPEFLQSIYSKDGVPETVTTATSLLQGETVWKKNLIEIVFSNNHKHTKQAAFMLFYCFSSLIKKTPTQC